MKPADGKEANHEVPIALQHAVFETEEAGRVEALWSSVRLNARDIPDGWHRYLVKGGDDGWKPCSIEPFVWANHAALGNPRREHSPEPYGRRRAAQDAPPRRITRASMCCFSSIAKGRCPKAPAQRIIRDTLRKRPTGLGHLPGKSLRTASNEGEVSTP